MIKKNKPVVVGTGGLLWSVFPSEKTVRSAPVNFVYQAIRADARTGYGTHGLGSRQVTGYLPFLYK